MEKEYRSKKDLERLFWSADIYVGMGFTMIWNRSTKAAKGQGVSLEGCEETRRIAQSNTKKGFERLGAPTFMSAWVLPLDDMEPIHEGGEWKRSIARRVRRDKENRSKKHEEGL